MTEQQWLTCTDPNDLLNLLRGKASDRKLRLFACACCRRIWNLLQDKRSRKALECSEQFADGRIDKERLSAARKEAEGAWWRRVLKHGLLTPDEECRIRYAAEAIKFVASATGRTVEHFHRMQSAARISLGAELLEAGSSSSQPKSKRCSLLYDIFGNPFRPQPVVISSWLTWNDCIVPKLAQVIYDDCAFDRLPILADALEEAGCTNADILNHCRQPGEHVRGCWVVDLLLGKC